jgi:SAM-dependent methyltransferase
MKQSVHCNLCGSQTFEKILTKDGFDVVECADCGLIFVANPPTDADRARLYSFQTGYHATLSKDDGAIAQHEREASSNLSLLLRHARSGRLLDIGCSTGLFLKAARDAGWLGQGLEYSPDSARIASQVHGLDVKCGELTGDTYAPGSFDVVTMWDVIEHLPDPSAAIRILANVIAPDGLLVLKTPNADGLYPRASRRLAKLLGFWGHAEPPGHLYQFSESTLRRLVCRAGFEVEAVHQQRIPLVYSFGDVSGWFRSAKWAAYCVAFVPLAFVGPLIRSGDDMVLLARRRGAPAA